MKLVRVLAGLFVGSFCWMGCESSKLGDNDASAEGAFEGTKNFHILTPPAYRPISSDMGERYRGIIEFSSQLEQDLLEDVSKGGYGLIEKFKVINDGIMIFVMATESHMIGNYGQLTVYQRKRMLERHFHFAAKRVPEERKQVEIFALNGLICGQMTVTPQESEVLTAQSYVVLGNFKEVFYFFVFFPESKLYQERAHQDIRWMIQNIRFVSR